MSAARHPSGAVCLGFAQQGVRTSVVRLPPTTYGPGSSGFMSISIGTALQKGVVAYVDGEDEDAYTWSAGHRDDAAKLYRLAMEKGGQPGSPSTFHAASQEAVRVKDIAAGVGKLLGLPVVSIAPEKVAEHFGMFHFTMTVKNVISSAKTREALGWIPTRPTLLEDLPEIVDAVKAQAH